MPRYQSINPGKSSVAANNLVEFDLRQADMFESRCALIHELVRWSDDEAHEKSEKSEWIKELYRKLRPGNFATDELKDYCIPDTVNSLFESISVIEKLEICRAAWRNAKLPRSYSQFLLELGEEQPSESVDERSIGRIAYMKNNYTESAFLKLSKIISNARSAYFSSFDDVCDEVYSGGCEFCILPIESSSEGRLNSFYSMIDRFELKIAATCVVEHHDSQRFTRFALLKKSLYEIPKLRSSSKEQIFEFKFSARIGDISPVSDILSAARHCLLKLIRIDSLPLPYNDEMISYYVSLNVSGGDLMTFLTYLTLEFPQCEPLGVYFLIK